MFNVYLKSAWRNLIAKKGHSLINIGGLTIGMAATLLIGMWVYDEVSYDRSIENYDTIVRMKQKQRFEGEISVSSGQPMQLAPAIREQYGDHFKQVVTCIYTQDVLLTVGEKKISRPGSFMEPGITEMLALQMLKGSRDALKDPQSVLLSQESAEILFGDKNPVGEIIKMGSSLEGKVAGIYQDLPKNSYFGDLTFIAPWEMLAVAQNYEERLGWGNSWFQVLAQVEDNADVDKISSIIKNVKADHIDEDYRKRTQPEIFLHPMSKWYLYARFENGVNTGGRIEYVWMFGIIGMFVLLLACINFMNLSTAKSMKRAKEVGIRKTIGSARHQLITQFFVESFLVVITAFVFSLALVLVLQPFFNELTNKEIGIPWTNLYFWLISLGFIGLTGLLSGSYPALYLSSFRPVKVLKGTFQGKNSAILLRRVLVVFQFSISIILIIGTITVFRQIQYVKNRPLGYNSDRMLYVPINTKDVLTSFATIREDLMQSNQIEEVAASDVRITGTYTTNSGFTWPGKDPNMSEEFYTLRATHGYGDMIGWEIKEGRDFSRDFQSDSLSFLLNETAVEYMGLENPIGQTVTWGNNGGYKVVGIVKDMVTRSPYDPVKPAIFVLHYGRFLSYINIKLKSDLETQEALAHIESVFKKHDPTSIFDYTFVEADFEKNFVREERIGKLASFFAILAIIISCLGIFGLSTFMAEQRTKEIGVRKVLGASIFIIWQILTKDFVRLVVVSCLIAIPISYYYMSNWVAEYEYHTTLNWWIFAIAVISALFITLLTVSFQAIKAAIINPVKSLRSE